ncbi:hypothetical protein MAPG_02301 [Magnaporthiopsis poae ATCC 64411]|uniref:Uncharacterized protein n=1 Tax=Magnaporthiopsis poae (strain ATCC 64411 / 73-15) TaxID=644358 RepID=A0A0C4DR02_MAGP6|nr:hypothetical protein MAPG_02301 [Magnaporthiopsis poae ATCC 64411]
MPSFSLLRRSAKDKDRPPADQQAQQRQANRGGIGGGWVASWTRHEAADPDGGDRARTIDDVSGNGNGTGNGSNGSDDNSRRGASSKRELLHGLINRSIRGRGRLLVSTASSSPSAGASNPPTTATAGPVAAAPAPPPSSMSSWLGRPCAVEPAAAAQAGHRPPTRVGDTAGLLVLAMQFRLTPTDPCPPHFAIV